MAAKKQYLWKVGEWRKEKAPTEECVGLTASPRIVDAMSYVNLENPSEAARAASEEAWEARAAAWAASEEAWEARAAARAASEEASAAASEAAIDKIEEYLLSRIEHLDKYQA